MRNQHYQTLAPWDSRDLNPPRPMVKTFQKPEFLVRNQDLTPREIRTTLPALEHNGKLTKNQTRLLRESIGQQLFVARPDVINKLQKSMKASDRMKYGTVSTAELGEILRDQNVRLEDNVIKSLTTKFDGGGTGKIHYADLLEFMSSALDEYKWERDKNEFQNLPRYPQRSRARHPSMNSSDFNLAPLPKRGMMEEDFTGMPGAYSRVKMNETFNERRDAAIRIEVERSCQNFHGDLYYVVQNLRKSLMSREEDMVNSYKLKGIVNRHQLPINDALIVKMIERLDPHGTDSVSCKAFMEFLEKSLPLPSRDEGRIKASKNAKLAEKKPERPRWETSKPLGAIKPNRHESSGESEHAEDAIKHKSKEGFERLEAALKGRSKDSDKVPTEAALRTILTYNEFLQLGLSDSEVNSVLQENERNGYVYVDSIIDAFLAGRKNATAAGNKTL